MSFYDQPRRSSAIFTAVPRALAPSPTQCKSPVIGVLPFWGLHRPTPAQGKILRTGSLVWFLGAGGRFPKARPGRIFSAIHHHNNVPTYWHYQRPCQRQCKKKHALRPRGAGNNIKNDRARANQTRTRTEPSGNCTAAVQKGPQPIFLCPHGGPPGGGRRGERATGGGPLDDRGRSHLERDAGRKPRRLLEIGEHREVARAVDVRVI